MNQSLKNNLCILNIFKDDDEFLEQFITHHSAIAKKVIMLNTGNVATYNKAQIIARRCMNVEVYYHDFPEVNFSDFRNTCLKFAPKDIEYHCWIDTDELLEVLDDNKQFDPAADAIRIERFDKSLIFSTFLMRCYRSNVDGIWRKRIHEHFQLRDGVICETVDWLKINHLTSEAQRPAEKKQLYFSLLEKELEDAKKRKDRQIIIDNLQHIILMASHDFRNPELCLKYYDEFKDFIDSMTKYEISAIQKFNVLLHALISRSRLGKKPTQELIDKLYEVDKSRSSVFQILRALSFNPDNAKMVRNLYLNEYPKIIELQTHEFNNTDYKNEKEILWLERKIGISNVK